jgi:hypothetical protein
MVNVFINLPGALQFIDGKNYDSWHKQMKLLFGFQDVFEIVDSGYEALVENATETQRE